MGRGAGIARHECIGVSRRLKQQHPSLLIGKVIDGEGCEMTPSHASKSRRRYRYYATRPDQLDGSRAWRVSAHDLEQLVCTSIAGKLTGSQFIIDLSGSELLLAEQLQRARDEAELAATTLRSGKAHAKAESLGAIVRQVRLHEDRVDVELDNDAIENRLGLSLELGLRDPMIITIEAIRVRRGHQLRLVVPGRALGNQKPVRRDDKLVALMAEAQQAKVLVLAQPEKSIACIAREQGRCRTRLGKLVALSCLAPDIVTSIVEGRQPENLTAFRLMSKPLPLAWTDQRRELGLS